MAKTANLTVRLEPEIKKQAEDILDKLGIPASSAVDMFYRQVILNKGLPFEAKLPDNIFEDFSTISKDQLKKLIDKALNDDTEHEEASLAFKSIYEDLRWTIRSILGKLRKMI